jgi:hypothetical protein
VSGLLDFWKKIHLGPMKQIFKTTTLGGSPEKNLMIAAALIGGGTLLPGLLGGAAATGAAGAGAAAGGGAAAGMGGTLGGTAGMFGAAPGMASSFMAPAALTPMFTGGAAGLGGAGVGTGLAGAEALAGIGGMSAFGPGAAGMSSLSALSGPGAGMTGSIFDGMTASKMSDYLGKAQKLTQQDKQQAQPAQMPRPQPQIVTDNEALRRLLKMYGGYQV